MNRRVYIAGPYSRGDVEANISKAIDAANVVLQQGDWPYIPHLTHYWHIRYPHDSELWMQLDFCWLEQSEVLIRLPGASNGADQEVNRAKELDMPVYYGMGEYLAGIVKHGEP